MFIQIITKPRFRCLRLPYCLILLSISECLKRSTFKKILKTHLYTLASNIYWINIHYINITSPATLSGCMPGMLPITHYVFSTAANKLRIYPWKFGEL